jgi:hypothetical protein
MDPLRRAAEVAFLGKDDDVLEAAQFHGYALGASILGPQCIGRQYFRPQ